MHTCIYRNRKGFTLLEMAIVMAIIGLVAIGGFGVMFAYQGREAELKTRDRLQFLQQAMLEYSQIYNRIPCPADITLPLTNANFGVEATTASDCYTVGAIKANFSDEGYTVAGGIPTKALKLPDEYALDGWGRRLLYAVDRRMTATNSFINYPFQAGSPAGSISVKDATEIDRSKNATSISAASATFIGTDLTTKGNWHNGTYSQFYYGNGVHFIANIPLPFVNKGLETWGSAGGGGVPVTLSDPSADTNALYKPDATGQRIASFWRQNAGSISYLLTNHSNNRYRATFYFWDIDNQGREQTITVTDESTGAVLDTQTISSFQSGIYLSWLYTGEVRFTITHTAGPSAVLNAFFVDDVSGAVYAITSFGANGHGAYPMQGGTVRINKGSVNTDELENCDCTSAAVATAFDWRFVQKSPTENPADANDKFDDLIVFGTRGSMPGLAD